MTGRRALHITGQLLMCVTQYLRHHFCVIRKAAVFFTRTLRRLIWTIFLIYANICAFTLMRKNSYCLTASVGEYVFYGFFIFQTNVTFLHFWAAAHAFSTKQCWQQFVNPDTCTAVLHIQETGPLCLLSRTMHTCSHLKFGLATERNL